MERELHPVTLQINGYPHEMRVPADEFLLDTLRDRLGLFGAREGCGVGFCGACTVLVDGRLMSSCLLLTVQVEGCSLTTVEGLSQDGQLHPVQQAFIDCHAFQCAYCTPGFILTAVALLNEDPHPDEAAIRDRLSGNLCRCGSYVNIVEAVQQASRQRGGESP